jgi:hypothetical protein
MQDKFESWGVVELFGHTTIAGKISEATIGGCSFVRVDVPNFDQSENAHSPWAYTRFLGQGAIYALNPTSEDVARIKARGCQEPPFAWEVKRTLAEEAVEAYKRRSATLQIDHSNFDEPHSRTPDDDPDDDDFHPDRD